MDMNMNMSMHMRVGTNTNMVIALGTSIDLDLSPYENNDESGREPSTNINLAMSHRQNIDMTHGQTYQPLRSDTIHGSFSPLASIPYSRTNSHSNPR